MPKARRSATFPAEAGDVWRVVGDEHHFARWWPRVQRVEGVDAGGFTWVMQTDKGRIVRVDFHVVDRAARAWRWAQDIEGTPFERVLRSAEWGVQVEPSGAGSSVVTLSVDQRLRGLSSLGSFMVRRATKKILNEALGNLGQVVGPEPAGEPAP